MKFVIDDVKRFYDGSNHEAKMLMTVSQYMGDRSVVSSDVENIPMKGKIIDTEDFIINETTIVSYIGEVLLSFLQMRSDIYESEDLKWCEDYNVYMIGNYILSNMKKNDLYVKKIKDLIKKYRVEKEKSNPVIIEEK